MIIDFNLMYESLPYLFRGALVSLSIAALGCLIGFIGGTIFALLQTNAVRVVRMLVSSFTAIVRGTPMLIQITFMFILLPTIGIYIPAFWVAVIAIGINSTAYVSNVIRAGILSVARGQIEAAYTLGLTRLQTIRYIVLPQAVRTVLPSLGNEFVTLIKDSSLASVIGVYELTKEGSFIISRHLNSISIYIVIAGIYLLMTIPLTLAINYLEKRMHRHVSH